VRLTGRLSSASRSDPARTHRRVTVSSDEESSHFRNREALYRIVSAPEGEAVVEVFPLYASGLAPLPPPTPSASPSTARRSLVVVDIGPAPPRDDVTLVVATFA